MIEIRNVSHYYANSEGTNTLRALDDVSLTIEQGTFVSFLGPSGCGKTTLLRIINGLMKPSAGTVRIAGRPVTGPGPDRAMVFQEFNLLPWRTARGNIELPLELMGGTGSARAQAANRALARVGLERFAGFYPHQLSGGMKQRIGLARALSIDPAFLFMDEPFGALDLQTRELMQIELMKIWDGDRRTAAFVTHSVDEAVFLSDRIVVFSAQPGRVIADIAIDLPRPRWTDEESLKASPAFIRYRHDIWHILKQQIAAMPDMAVA